MKIEDTYEFWVDYIKNNMIRDIPSGAYPQAEYEGLDVCHEPNGVGFNFVFFRKNEAREFKFLSGIWHRLDGPAVIDARGEARYWLDNALVSYDQWLKDPRVIQARIAKIINEVLGE